jgi:HK97 family phage major capsid protein
MTPRVAGKLVSDAEVVQGLLPALRRELARGSRTSFQEFRAKEGDMATTAFWRWATAPAWEAGDMDALGQAHYLLPQEEFRVLSKAASGGGFLVPSDVEEMITAAARAASAVAQAGALDIKTDKGDTLGIAVVGTHGSAAWIAESGSYTPSDETITQQNLGAFKGGTKIIVSEELRTDEDVDLDAYLAFELGGRLGALQENAFVLGDGSGKPLGLVHTSSPYTIVTAATGSASAFKLADLKAVYKALPLAYRRNAAWLMNGDDFAELASLTDTAGALVLPSLQFDPPSLFGRPVLLSGDLPAPGANAKSIVLADFRRAYGIRRVNGIELQRQDELHSDSGQVGFRCRARVDGRPLLADAARILAHSAT